MSDEIKVVRNARPDPDSVLRRLQERRVTAFAKALSSGPVTLDIEKTNTDDIEALHRAAREEAANELSAILARAEATRPKK